MYWRNLCDGEDFDGATDCGRVFWDDSSELEYWVTCDTYDSWEECTCDRTWYYDVCLDQYWQYDCWGDDGWWFWESETDSSYWMTSEEYD